MNRDKIIIAVTIGIICFILSFVLTVQMRTVRETDIVAIENIREDELKEQVKIWKTKYEETQSKIDEDNAKISEYKEKVENNQEASELLEKEVAQMNTQLGKTDVEGEGIIITLNNGQSEIVSENLIDLVNELKLAGAEAISINNQRIMNLTDIVDVNSYVLINGERTTAPFEIKAIGNTQYLSSGINAKGGYSDKMKNSDKIIDVVEQKNVKINKYNKELKLKTIKLN